MELTRERLAGMIDHTLLKPQSDKDAIDRISSEAKEHSFASVCVNPFWVPRCAQALSGTGVLVCTVIGFPLGADAPGNKAAEAGLAASQGAQELDMVMNVGAFMSGDFEQVSEDIASVVEAADGRTVKVILESGFLDDSQLEKACGLSVDAGAHFVKTSTGFGPACTPEQVALMRRIVGDRAKVKASGGIRNFDDAVTMIRAGAHRLGASAGIAILEGWMPTEV